MFPPFQQPTNFHSFSPSAAPMFQSPQMSPMPPMARGGGFLSRLFGGGGRLFGGGAPAMTQGANQMMHAAPRMAQGFGGFMGASGVPNAGGLLGGGSAGGLFGSGGLSNIMSMIQNTQRVIGVVQSVTPMIQQYGPLLRSMPQIYQILKKPNAAAEVKDGETKQHTIETPKSETVKENKKEEKIEELSEKIKIQPTRRKLELETIQGPPKPKLYV